MTNLISIPGCKKSFKVYKEERSIVNDNEVLGRSQEDMKCGYVNNKYNRVIPPKDWVQLEFFPAAFETECVTCFCSKKCRNMYVLTGKYRQDMLISLSTYPIGNVEELATSRFFEVIKTLAEEE